MTFTPLQIHLPPSFSAPHERAVTDYLEGKLQGRIAWATAFEAFDLLDGALVVLPAGRFTFRSLYQRFVDRPLSDAYLGELLALSDV